jgi:Leucine-rich repeat (LRR) protein
MFFLLTQLLLHNNNLTVLPPEIENLTKLSFFGLENNKFTKQPPEIEKLNNLKRFYFAGNTEPKPTEILWGFTTSDFY